jgi:hypothetical protein
MEQALFDYMSRRKKIFQISLMVVVALALVAGLFQFASGFLLDVGWKSGVRATYSQDLHLACKSCGAPGTDITPNVGWNSGISAAPILQCTTRLCPDVGWNS